MFLKRVVVWCGVAIILSACTAFPGATISTEGKPTVDTGEANLNELVEIRPITPRLINELRVNPAIGQANDSVQEDIANYEYRIGVGDVLNVTVWDHPELTIPAGSFRSASEAGNWVHSDGTIFYPYVGKVRVVGKTVGEIRDLLTNRLTEYIESPQVDVNLAAFRSQKVYVAGEVREPGSLPITNVPLTLVDALNEAGGLTDNADWQHVVFTRDGKDSTLSLRALLRYGDLSDNRLLRHGDMIYVPRNDSQKVFVMGEVNRGTTLTIGREGMSLTEALSSSEGLDQAAAKASGVFVLRPSGNETARSSLYQLDMSDATALLMATEFELQPYDVVYVTTAPVTRWNRVLSQIVPTMRGFNDLTEGARRIHRW